MALVTAGALGTWWELRRLPPPYDSFGDDPLPERSEERQLHLCLG